MKRSKPQPSPTAKGAEVLRTTMCGMAATTAGAAAVLGSLVLMAAPPAGIAEPIKKLTRMR